jgi:signal transduction histidine kinase
MNPHAAALAVHDLKNELGALEGLLVQLEAAPEGPRAATARRRCAQLRRRFVAFLLLYRDGEDMHALPADESPLALLQGIVGSLGDAPAGVAVRVGACSDAPPYWFFDVRLLRLALDSALHNALRFARREVVIDAALRGRHLVISIDDDGPGPASPGPAPTGASACDAADAMATGLGTALCRAVARAHRHDGAEGWVRLVARPGGGARFEIALP